MNKIRAHISLDTQKKILDFITQMNLEPDIYFIENESGTCRVDAHSMLGVIYASGDFVTEMYLVNETENGYFPFFINEYRV